MLDKLLPLLGVFVSSLLGTRLSPRMRLRGHIAALARLANELEPGNAKAASEIRKVIDEAALGLAALERRALHRRFDPSGLAALILLLCPAAIGTYYVWDRRTWWAWLMLAAILLWALVVIAAGWRSIWKGLDPGGGAG